MMISKLQGWRLPIALILIFLMGCEAVEETLTPSTAIPAAPSLEVSAQADEPTQAATVTKTEDVEPTDDPPTLVPTVTITQVVELPTPTPAPVSVPPVQPLDLNNLPPTNYDLAYVASGKLWLWTHQNRQISPLFEPEVDLDRFPAGTFAEVTLADFSADGNRAAVVVRYDLPPETAGDGSGDTESEVEAEESSISEYDLYFVDTVSKESWLLVKGIEDEVNEVAISPDQKQIVFATFDGSDEEDISGRLFRIETPSGTLSEVVQVSGCDGRCANILWRQDSELYLFADLDHVYFANAQAIAAEVAIESQSDDESFRPVAWAPNDRAFLLIYWSVDNDGPIDAVFDFPTNSLIQATRSSLPNGFILPQTGWLADSRLITAYALTDSDQLLIQTYRINFDDATSVVDEQLELAEFQMLGSLQQLQDGRFVFVAPDLDDPNRAGLYRLTSFTEQAERVNGLPLTADTPDAFWATDGSAAVISTFSSIMAAADGNLYQFSQQLSNVKWLPQSDARR